MTLNPKFLADDKLALRSKLGTFASFASAILFGSSALIGGICKLAKLNVSALPLVMACLMLVALVSAFVCRVSEKIFTKKERLLIKNLYDSANDESQVFSCAPERPTHDTREFGAPIFNAIGRTIEEVAVGTMSFTTAAVSKISKGVSSVLQCVERAAEVVHSETKAKS